MKTQNLKQQTLAGMYQNLLARGGVRPPPPQGYAPHMVPQNANFVPRYAGPTLPGQVPLAPGAAPPPMLPPQKQVFGIGGALPPPPQLDPRRRRFTPPLVRGGGLY